MKTGNALSATSRTATAQSTDLMAYGEPNPNAPKELSEFAFLIGKWRAEGKSLESDRRWGEVSMMWTVQYILDGYAIAGVYQTQGEGGEWATSAMDFRFYDRGQDRWIIEYMDPATLTLVAQAPEDLGGVQVSETSITLMTRKGDILGRETYLNITEDHVTYRGEASPDGGESWCLYEETELLRIDD